MTQTLFLFIFSDNTHGTERVILPAVNRPVANVHPHARNGQFS